MTIEQAISFGVTVGLGVVSIILAIFAIWLSLRFARDSEKALALIQEKATEIRTLTAHILAQQDRHITKIVDHVLRRTDEGMSEVYAHKRDAFWLEIEKALKGTKRESNDDNE